MLLNLVEHIFNGMEVLQNKSITYRSKHQSDYASLSWVLWDLQSWNTSGEA